jgi:hypothetical protein
MTTIEDLRLTLETAYFHCRPGGGAVFAPDYVRETFAPATEHGGHDGTERGLRYLAWVWDPDPCDSTYLVDYAYLLRNANGSVRAEHDRHIEGLFTRAEWLAVLRDVGFEPQITLFEHSEVDRPLDIFIARRPCPDNGH